MDYSPSRTKKVSVQSNADTQSRHNNVQLTPEMRDTIDKQGKYADNIILALAILERTGIKATQTIVMAILEVKSNAVARALELVTLNRVIRLEENLLADILLADCLTKDIVKALILLISAGISATPFLITKIIAADDPMILASALYNLHVDEIVLDENLISHIANSGINAQVVANDIRSPYNIDGTLPLLRRQLDSISEEKTAATLPFFEQDQKKTSSSHKEQQAFSENRLG